VIYRRSVVKFRPRDVIQGPSSQFKWSIREMMQVSKLVIALAVINLSSCNLTMFYVANDASISTFIKH
jgi:hypothetical protein